MPTLHITNGDSAADTLRLIVDGRVTIVCDVLHEGPCPAIEGEAWHDVRARFLASPGRVDEVKASLAAADRAIADACRAQASAERPAIVLWFEHDLFDQLELIRTLDLAGRLLADPAQRVSLICIDRFPGVDRFIGLGQLSADQLATLVGTGVPVTPGHCAIAAAAWAAFRSPDPRALLAVPESGALPFLHAALRRFLAEYPSAANGLSRTEELALEALAAGETTGGALFAATQAREPAPFMGDRPFFDILQRLATARVPLVARRDADGGDLRGARLAVTNAGRDVLAGRADHIRLNGIDLWRGGVHLAGSDRSPWRWDTRAETLVS